jgi:hypothetical protein
MAGLPDLIGLLYRADWTRLSLSAELRAEYGQEPPRLRPRPRSRAHRASTGPAGTATGRGRGKTTAATWDTERS